MFNPLINLWPLLIECLLCLMTLVAVMLLFRKQRFSSWLMMVGAVLMLWSILIIFLPYTLSYILWATLGELMQGMALLHAFGPGLVFVGFLLHALEYRGSQQRILELETIAADQQERLALWEKGIDCGIQSSTEAK